MLLLKRLHGAFSSIGPTYKTMITEDYICKVSIQSEKWLKKSFFKAIWSLKILKHCGHHFCIESTE